MNHQVFRRLIPLLLAVFMLLSAAAEGTEGDPAMQKYLVSETPAEAEEITALCTLAPASGKKTISKCRDGRFKTHWDSDAGKGAAVIVTPPEGQYAGGVWLQWYDHPHGVSLQIQDENGEWQECARTEGTYLSEYADLPGGTTCFRIANPKGTSRSMKLAEMHVYGAGTRPRRVQVWNPPAEKAELMIIVAHPDDEVLWFGGMLPTYAGQQGRVCQVCMMVPAMPWRRLELLDCLWTCGVKNYPVWAKFRDSFSLSLSKQYTKWNKGRVYEVITEWIRRFKPEVLATHDTKGEYGHGAHRVCADAVMHCLDTAANKKKYPDSAREYGVWDVPKCYLHLYPENVVDLDWRQPLTAFEGRTSFEVAEEAFRCHVSQQVTEYRVRDEGDWDCSLFGLYRSLVGEDVEKKDIFEHLN